MKNKKVYGEQLGLSLMSLLIGATVHAAEQVEPPLTEASYWEEVPVVMSATRMSQPVVDAPVAVTVIDRRMIEASGAREIPELFRLVPGFMVGYHDGHTPSVSYHLSEDRYARQMQVLIDGRSVYTTAIGGIPWSTLHITLDDIERIEVVRGPNSASYGANSFLGVINIITRNTLLDHGTSVKTNLGDEGMREVFLRHGDGAGKLDYRVTAGFVEDDGFPNRLDYKRTQMAAIRADYSISTTDMLTFETGAASGPRGVENRVTLKSLSPDREKSELAHHQHLKWSRNLGQGEGVEVQLYHIYQRNYETFTTGQIPLATSGGLTWVVEPMFVDFSRETHRYNLEMQHNVNLANEVRAAWGAGLRDDQVWGGENLMANQEVHNHLKFGFMNLEWNPSNPWLFNAGAMLEDYSTTGTSLSPRAGVNYRFSPENSMRLTVSKAIRTPSMYEYAANYHFSGSSNYYSGTTLAAAGPDIFQQYDVGTRRAEVEKITSYELGFHGTPVPGRVEYDVKIYQDDLTDLLGTDLNTPVPGDLDNRNFLVVNRNFYIVQGAELEAKFTLFDSSALHFGYAFAELDRILKANGIDTREESRNVPEHIFSMLYMMDFERGYSAGVGFYFTDRIQGWESGSLEKVRDPVSRLDLKVARKFDLHGYDTELALAARNVLGKYEEMEVLRPQANYKYLNEVDPSAYVTIKVHMN